VQGTRKMCIWLMGNKQVTVELLSLSWKDIQV